MITYRSIVDLQERHRLLLPHNEDWRLTPPYPVGQITALPETHGRLICTNGVLCYVLLDTYMTKPDHKVDLFLGHIQWFMTDASEARQLVESYTTPALRPVPQPRATLDVLKARYNI